MRLLRVILLCVCFFLFFIIFQPPPCAAHSHTPRKRKGRFISLEREAKRRALARAFCRQLEAHTHSKQASARRNLHNRYATNSLSLGSFTLRPQLSRYIYVSVLFLYFVSIYPVNKKEHTTLTNFNGEYSIYSIVSFYIYVFTHNVRFLLLLIDITMRTLLT